MLARDRKPEQTVITNLRIKESLRATLEQEAKEHQLSLNKEIINRLEDSLEAGAQRKFIDIADDMMRNWMRFGRRYLILGLEEDILTAIEDGDLEAARSLVHALRREQERVRRLAAKAAEKGD